MRKNRKIKAIVLGTLFVGFAAAWPAIGGTINIDTGNQGNTLTEPGIVGDGSSWNHIGHSDTIAVVNDQGVALPDTFVATGGSGYGSETSNVLQQDSINGGANGSVSLSVFGLRPGAYYKVIVFHGSNSNTPEVSATNGETKSLAHATLPGASGATTGVVSQMVEGADYVVFGSVQADSGGGIGVSMQGAVLNNLAGIQVHGWLEGEDFPHKPDLQISKKKGSAYKGNDKYAGGQTQKIKGARAAKFYFRLQNDGSICGTYGARGKANDKKAKRKYFDLSEGRTNITAAVKTGTYQTALDTGSYRTIFCKMTKKRGVRKAVALVKGISCDKPAVYDKNKAVSN